MKRNRLLAALVAALMLLHIFPFPSAHAAYEGGMQGDGCGIYAQGVDLSTWQGHDVDFRAIAADGYQFVILRAGFSTTEDDTFEENYRKAKEAGLYVGAYLYSYASTVQEALNEAEACLRWLEGKELDYPVYFDLEDPQTHGAMSREALTELALAFLDRVRADGWLTGLYSCLSWLQEKIDTERIGQTHECWMAQYLNDGSCRIFDRYDDVYGMWQYTSAGTVSGVSGKADLNVCFKDYPSICRQYGLNGHIAAGETLYLSGVQIPQVLTSGDTISLRGRVTSKTKLLNVTAGIFDETGTMLRGRSIGPKSGKLDLAQLNFAQDGLADGDYYFRILASNSYETKTLLQQRLTISSAGLALRNLSAPQSIRETETLRLSGTLLSAAPLRSVQLSILGKNGETVKQVVASPNDTTFSLDQLDGMVLPFGGYRLVLTAVSGNGQETLVQQELAVWKQNDPIHMDGFSLKQVYASGEKIQLKGSVASDDSELHAVTVRLVAYDGTLISATSDGGKKTILLQDLVLPIGWLAAGSYTLEITAENDAGPVTLAEQTFLVKADAISLCGFDAPLLLCEGDSRYLQGAVLSDVSALTFVSVSVTDEKNHTLLDAAAVPEGACFDLAALNDRFLLSSLRAGEYRMVISAQNAQGLRTIYDSPLQVTDQSDIIFWQEDAYTAGGLSYSYQSPPYVWGSLASVHSPITEVSILVTNAAGDCVSAAFAYPNTQTFVINEMNESLRLTALTKGNYTLSIRAKNAAGEYLVSQSDFSLSVCDHTNFSVGVSVQPSCTECGAVADSRCNDCGAAISAGMMLSRKAHSYNEGVCESCGAKEYVNVGVEAWDGLPMDQGRYLVATHIGKNWFALAPDGETVAISAPNEDGTLVVSAELLWRVRHDGNGASVLSHGKRRTLHLDRGGITVGGGIGNGALCWTADAQGLHAVLSSDSTRSLGFENQSFCVSEQAAEIVLFALRVDASV